MESGPAATAVTPRPLVLVCDDIESIRDIIRINLELEGFDVLEAADGHEAMSHLIDPSARVPDVILLDAQTPRRDGLWAIAAIRSHRPGDQVTLAYTRDGSQDTATATLGSDAGAS